MGRLGVASSLPVLVLLLLRATAAPEAQAQVFRGVGSCAGSECHTRSGEVEWLNSKPGGKEHRASLGRLRSSLDVSEKYAKAVGLDDVFTPKGMCMKCHGAVPEATKIPEGVGCEGCHGPAGGYRDFHQKTPKDYAGAVSRGLRDLKGKPTAWTRVCRDCHVLDDPEYGPLLDAGHKEGNRWKAKDKFTGVQAHWKRVSYTVAMITEAEAGKAVTVAVADSPAPPEPAKPVAADPSKPAVGTPPVTPPTVDPGLPIRPLPIPEAPARPSLQAPKEPSGGGGASTRFSPSPPASSTVDPRVATPIPRTVDPSVASGGVPSPLALPAADPVTPADLLAAFQSRVAAFLSGLLTSGARPAQPLKPLPSPQVSGPDAEFLRIQAEALALAVEALNLRVPIPAGAGK